MIVIADSTPLIYLAAIDCFDLLKNLFGQLVIPTAVYEEVVTRGAGRAGGPETVRAAWIVRRAVTDRSKVDRLLPHLDLGEAETIVLAEELKADLVVVDEAAARSELTARGLPFTGTVGMLIESKRRGLVGDFESKLDRLRTVGFHLSDHVHQLCLRLAGQPLPG